jgi:hypothetical protein
VDGTSWDTAINVGTNDADDLLRFRLVFDFQVPTDDLGNPSDGCHEITDDDPGSMAG